VRSQKHQIPEANPTRAYIWYRIIAQPVAQNTERLQSVGEADTLPVTNNFSIVPFLIALVRRHYRARHYASVGSSSGSGWLSAGCCAAVQGASLSGQMPSS
jgi:hypothetical protein